MPLNWVSSSGAVTGRATRLGPGGADGSRREMVLAMGWRALTVPVSGITCLWGWRDGAGFITLLWGLEASV